MANLEIISSLINEEARFRNKEKTSVDYLSEETIEEVRHFHESFDEYSISPLHKLDALANRLKLKEFYLKDESYRFGLNAFKVLGGSYAIGKYLAERLGLDISQVSFEYLRSKEVREKLGDITFVTATDGNHGRGIAWAARQLGQKSVVYMPKGSSEIRLENIRNEGADASIIEGNYDDAVRLANEMAEKHGWVVVQDTAWEGYEDIPTWIMQGYGTIIHEALEQLFEHGIERPTHVLLQAGVGSFAGAIQGYLVSKYGEDRPITIIVEPDEAPCLYNSALSGKREIVTGSMSTIMAGLACGEPNTISWEVLKSYSDCFMKCSDYVAEIGMRVLGKPFKNDPTIVSGESGAVTTGVISALMTNDNYKGLRKQLGLNKDSVILVISTEGDTDPVKYNEIIKKGSSLADKVAMLLEFI